MCLSKAQGGRRCDVSDRIEKAEKEVQEFHKNDLDVPERLNRKLDNLYEQHSQQEAAQKLSDQLWKAKNEKKKQEAAERLAAKQAKEAEKEEKLKKAEERKARQPAPAVADKKVYITPSEQRELVAEARYATYKKLKEEGEFEEFAEKAVLRSDPANPTWEEYSANHENASVEEYLNRHNVEYMDACKLTRTSPYGAIKERLKNPPVMSKDGASEVAAGGRDRYIQPREQLRGRHPSTYTDKGVEVQETRSEPVKMGMDFETNTHIERVAEVYGVTHSEALRCLLLGKDPHEFQGHHSLSKHKKRMDTLRRFENDPDYRKETETRKEFYSRMIAEKHTTLPNRVTELTNPLGRKRAAAKQEEDIFFTGGQTGESWYDNYEEEATDAIAQARAKRHVKGPVDEFDNPAINS